MLDKYFTRPLLWDYIAALIIIAASVILNYKGCLTIPKEEYVNSTTSDLTTIALTLAGFILTLLTVLITFKSTAKKKNEVNEDDSVFELFFATDLYFQTVKHLKNCIKSLIFICLCGYIIKLGVQKYHYLFFFNFLGIAIIVLTLLRSLLILTKIVDLQKQE